MLREARRMNVLKSKLGTSRATQVAPDSAPRRSSRCRCAARISSLIWRKVFLSAAAMPKGYGTRSRQTAALAAAMRRFVLKGRDR